LSKFGAFLGCNRYPDCKYTKPLADDDSADHNAGQAMFEPKTLGNDSSNGMEISLRKGPYGFYIQRELTAEEQGKKKSAKPKRAAVPKDLSIEDIDLVIAEKLLSLPRYIGIYDDTEQKAYSGVGPYGPYIRVGQKYISLPKEYDVLTVILDDEVKALIAEKLAEKPKSRRKTTKKK
jgi:DNA topoisomerase-1